MTHDETLENVWDLESHYRAGETVEVEPHTSKPGKGLTYPAMRVILSEYVRTGGWDVYNGIDEKGNEVSFYGFSVKRRASAPPNETSLTDSKG